MYTYIYLYYVYIQVWHLITQKQKAERKKKNTSQIKAVGALVCHKLRKSQTFACSKFTTFCK